ncbi:hypothetical protein BDV96DRAFT_465031, partial [Lophiotrema nucula]
DAFGPSAPSRNLAFPPTANMTAVELLTFLPHTLKSPSVIYRLVSNGFSRLIICSIINTQRTLAVPSWHPNSCGQAMIRTMRFAGYEDWTAKSHGLWFDGEKENWDFKSVEVGGFKTPFEAYADGKGFAEPIPFKDLMKGLRKVPEGGDALDLTRMVEYAVLHPREKWRYPTDWERLLEKVGGPAEAEKEHSDGEAFKRWEAVEGAKPKAPKPRVSRENSEAPRPRGRPRKSVEPGAALVAKKKGTLAAVRLGELDGAASKANDEPIEESLLPVERSRDSSPVEEYVRGRPKLVEPPYEIVFPSVDEIVQVFLKESDCSQPDPFNPYAFSGPRKSAPYRPLHCISPPRQDDVSGWAENLRWATEQKDRFGAEGWDERPEHMDLIWKERVDSEWVSDEWLSNYAKEQ